MNTEEFGERVAALRRQRNMSQRDLATAVKRSESWVSQVERGVYPVERIGLLQSLADALGVSLQDLRPDVPKSDATAADTPQAPTIGQLRLAVSGHPALNVLLSGAQPGSEVDPAGLAARVEYAWNLEHSGDYTEFDDLLPALLSELEYASRMAPEADRRELLLQLSRAYQIAGATFVRRDEADAAWLASDRAIFAADRAGEPLQAAAGHFRMAHAFMRINQMAQAEYVATVAAEALESHIASHDAGPEELSLFGAMNLVLAIIRGRENDRAGAKQYLATARKAAKRIGADRNDFNTEFGPTNVQLHELAVAIDVGDAGEALDLAASIDPSGLSPERQGRYWVDVARAHAQRRQVGDATSALLKAEEVAPEMARSRPLARETVALLVRLSGRRVPEDLAGLAQRVGTDL